MFYLLLREAAESSFMGQKIVKHLQTLFYMNLSGREAVQGYVTCVQRNDLIGCILSSCLIWGSLVGCLWLVVPQFFLESECTDSGLGFGLWAQTAKALEPLQSYGFLV